MERRQGCDLGIWRLKKKQIIVLLLFFSSSISLWRVLFSFILLWETDGFTPPVFFRAAACALPVFSHFPQSLLSRSTCCGCLVGLSTLEAFHASNCLITHTQTDNCQRIASQSSPPPRLSLKKTVSVLGLSGPSVVTRWSRFSQLKLWRVAVYCHAARARRGYFPASAWTYSCTLVQTKEKRWRKGREGTDMWCIQTTEWHTSQRPVFQLRRAQDHSQRRLVHTVEQKEESRGEGGAVSSGCFGTQNQPETKPAVDARRVEKGICGIFLFLPAENIMWHHAFTLKVSRVLLKRRW